MSESTTKRKPRVLIFVVAYEAASTLARVLKRIPSAIWELEVEVLVIDDSSRDRTFEVGLLTANSLDQRIRVLYNTTNQGYGGNQKLGYAYALRHGFDFVVLLHGDGQYAPECIPAILAPLINGSADSVFGSRMMIPGAARKGGMPLYKLVGNRILTWIQNRLLGTHFSEFHSGFRAYRVAALGRIPFEYNSNVFHFDTEIIIQFLRAGFRIVEVPIPTYYGHEICRVNGMKYAKDVFLTTLGSRLHGLNILYDRKFDVSAPANRRYGLKLGYASSHSMALDAIPEGARVLDVGCGPGDFARELRMKGCIIDGADQLAPVEPSPFRNFTLWKEPERLDVDLRAYDYVLLLDIVEHFKEPERFLDALRQASCGLDRCPRFIVTTGNVVFGVVRIQALLGHFNYGRCGILDLTHTRLYTFKSLRQLFEQCGFRVEKMTGVPAPFPLAVGMNRFGRALVKLNSLLIRLSRGLFSYQVFLLATPLPTVDALLDDSIAGSALKAETVLANAGEMPADLPPPRSRAVPDKGEVSTRGGRTHGRSGGAKSWTAATSIALAAVVALSAIILVGLGSRQFLNYDCVWHVFIAQQETWGNFWREVADNAHPPLYYLLLDAAIKILGKSFLAYRAISIVATLVSTLLVAKIVARITSNAWLSVVAAAAFGLSANAVEIGLEVRAYALCTALLLTAFAAYLDWLGVHPKRLSAWKLALCGAALTAAVLTSYSSFFFLAATVAVPLLLFISHRRWRAWLTAVVQCRPFTSTLMLGVPLATALTAFWLHARYMHGRLGHFPAFLYDPGRESVSAFIARTTRELILLMCPRVGTGGIVTVAVVCVLFAIAAWLTTRPAFRRRMGLVPFAFLAVMVALNIPAALTGRYPYGGLLRQDFYLFPFAIVALFVGIEAVRRAVPASWASPRLWVGVTGLAVAANCWLWMSANTVRSDDPTQRQMDSFQAAVGKPPAVLVDQFNFIILFGHYHDWTWHLGWQDPKEAIWQVWDVSRGTSRFRVCRSSQWLLDFSQPQTFANVADCLTRARVDRVGVFRIQQWGILPTWKTAATQKFARELGPSHGLNADTVVVDGHDLYLSFRSLDRAGLPP